MEPRRETEVLGGETCASATLTTAQLIWTEVWSNRDLDAERPKTNRLTNKDRD